MKIFTGDVQPDEGTIWTPPGFNIAYLSQELPVTSDSTVFEYVASGLQEAGDLISQYHITVEKLAVATEQDALMEQLQRLQQQLEAVDGWTLTQKVDSIMNRLELPADKAMAELSGGRRRRVAAPRRRAAIA